MVSWILLLLLFHIVLTPLHSTHTLHLTPLNSTQSQSTMQWPFNMWVQMAIMIERGRERKKENERESEREKKNCCFTLVFTSSARNAL